MSCPVVSCLVVSCRIVSQANKGKEAKPPPIVTVKSGRNNTSAVVKSETRRAESSTSSIGWQEIGKARDRQDEPAVAAAAVATTHAAPTKIPNGESAGGSRGRGRGGRGPSRGGGKAKQAKPARAEAEAPAAVVARSPEGERRQGESAGEATTPVVPQEAAERKERQSAGVALPTSSMRKSPRSKEVRRVPVCVVLEVESRNVRFFFLGAVRCGTLGKH